MLQISSGSCTWPGPTRGTVALTATAVPKSRVGLNSLESQFIKIYTDVYIYLIIYTLLYMYNHDGIHRI